MSEWTGVRGRRVILTGATSGIGLAAAQELARRGASLVIVARDETRAEAAADLAAAAGGGARPDVLLADLGSQPDVRRLAAQIIERYPRVGVLANNAGAVISGWGLTQDGIERTWALNHLGPFLLTTLLLDRLKESAPSRVITTASDAHRGHHIPFDDLDGRNAYRAGLFQGGFRRYGQTKLANILFTKELARRLNGTGVTAYCFHPGFVASNFNRNNGPLMRFGMSVASPFGRSSEKGAETLVWLADSPEVANLSGGYYMDKRLTAPTAAGQDATAAERLWTVSEEQTRLPSRGSLT
jgi:NAD(P)-dependent dehydrogenase (short-subunit alcohol dehydrogenase family)